MLFHPSTKNEEAIRNFFAEVHELYIKVHQSVTHIMPSLSLTLELFFFDEPFLILIITYVYIDALSLVKVLMNPFYEVNTPIMSKVFDERVKQIAMRRLFT
jgi:hypothetical protein